jgi:tetratricopeptide (TPR) repeat protein
VGRLDETVTQLAAEATAALDERDIALRAQVLAAESLARAYGGDADRARGLSEQALDLAERSGSTDALTDAVMARYASLAGAADGAASQLELVHRFPELAAPTTSARPRTSAELTGWPNLQLGNRAAFDRAVDELERFAAANPTPVVGSLLAVRRGVQALLDGRFDDVEQHATRAVQLSSGTAFTVHTFRAQLAWRALERGEQDTVLEMLAEVAAANPGLPAYRAGMAFALAAAGRLDEAERELVLVPLDQLVPDWTYTAQLTFLMESAALLGDTDRASALAALAVPYRGQLAVIGEAVVVGSVDRALGVVASLLGRHDDAEECFEAALALEQRVQAPPIMARTRSWHARMLAHRDEPGDAERAVVLAVEAARIATRLGMAGLARDAAALAAAAGARP